MPDATPVDLLYQDYQELIEKIDVAEVSLRETVRVNFSKSLLLAAASYFEERVKSHILDFAGRSQGNNELILEFIRKKAIEFQYHTFFEWKDGKKDGKNANKFFGLFGDDFRQEMVRYVREDSEYANAIRVFLHIGNQRNLLVHQNYAQFSLDSTPEEIYASYKVALQFVDSIGSHLARVSADLARRSAPDSS